MGKSPAGGASQGDGGKRIIALGPFSGNLGLEGLCMKTGGCRDGEA